MIEFGRIDISTDAFLLSSHIALPQQEHLFVALKIMSYFAIYHNFQLCIDPTLKINSNQFPLCALIDYYSKVEEPIQSSAPETQWKAVDNKIF